MSDPFIGQVWLVGYNFAQRGFSLCSGQLLPISQNTALFSLLGTTFGGDGRTTFGLPDLRGRAPIGVGSGAGLTNRQWGERGGLEQTVLTVNEMPSHTHTAVFTTKNLVAQRASGTKRNPEGNFLAGDSSSDNTYIDTSTASVNMNAECLDLAVTNTNAGSNIPFSVMSPYLGMYYEIALQGVFPSRS